MSLKVVQHSSAIYLIYHGPTRPLVNAGTAPSCLRYVLNTEEVDEAKKRIAEWKKTPEALEEGEACPIAEV